MHNPPIILITDDDTDFQDVIAAKFKAAGFTVELAHDGQEAVTRAKQITPDVMLLDVQMPVMDGVEALMKIREDDALKGIPVALLTAYGDPQPEFYKNDERFAQELGAVKYLLKTDDLNKLVDEVKELLPTS